MWCTRCSASSLVPGGGNLFYVLGAPFAAALDHRLRRRVWCCSSSFSSCSIPEGPPSAGSGLVDAWIWVGPIGLSAILLGEFIYLLWRNPAVAASRSLVEPRQLGALLFGPYLLAVELASMLLLAGSSPRITSAEQPGKGPTDTEGEDERLLHAIRTLAGDGPFALGTNRVLIRRNLIVMLMSVEIMLNTPAGIHRRGLALGTARRSGHVHPHSGVGGSEVAVGLASSCGFVSDSARSMADAADKMRGHCSTSYRFIPAFPLLGLPFVRDRRLAAAALDVTDDGGGSVGISALLALIVMFAFWARHSPTAKLSGPGSPSPASRRISASTSMRCRA